MAIDINVTFENMPDITPEAFLALRGEKGDPGETGADGHDGVGILNITQNLDGTLSINLDDGTSYVTEPLKGADGRDGTDGQDGAAGSDGNGIASAELNSNYTLTLTFTDGTSYTTPSIRGEKGEKGDRGDAGIVDTEMSDSSTSAVQNRVIKAYVDTGLSSKADTSTASTAANGLMSSADKTKLDGIADGAEKNFFTALSRGTTTPDQDQTTYVTDYLLTYRLNGDITDQIHVPNTKVATTAHRGLMSPTDKAKLDGIEGEAEKNVLTSIGYNASLTESSYALTYRSGSSTQTIDVPSTSLATTSKRGLMSSTDKTKLDEITATDISNWHEGLLDFDTAASSGDDYELTQILTSLGWLNDVIV